MDDKNDGLDGFVDVFLLVSTVSMLNSLGGFSGKQLGLGGVWLFLFPRGLLGS